jgi:hypothetical protein
VKVQIFDNSSYDPAPVVANRSQVGETIAPWFADASDELRQAVHDLQYALNAAPLGTLGAESTSPICNYLGITLKIADAPQAAPEAPITGEVTQEEIDRAGRLCRSEGVPIMYAENVARILRQASRKA